MDVSTSTILVLGAMFVVIPLIAVSAIAGFALGRYGRSWDSPPAARRVAADKPADEQAEESNGSYPQLVWSLSDKSNGIYHLTKECCSSRASACQVYDLLVFSFWAPPAKHPL
jgi:hypothetical protein